MKQVALRLDDELAVAIDRARGDVPREAWIRRALEVALTGSEAPAEVAPVSARPSSVASLRAPVGSPSSSLANFMPKGKR